MELVLLALLGSAFLGSFLFDLADDDDPEEEPDPELRYTGATLLEGSDGDDELLLNQPGELAPEIIDLKAGDDEAVVEHPFGIEVFGGSGDDFMGSAAVGNSLDGGPGQDDLRGIDATAMSGGSGADRLTLFSDTELNDSVARLDGGSGDDRLTVIAHAGEDAPDRGGALLTGGAGADSFEILLDLKNSDTDLDGDGEIASTIARITDFDPGEDVLSIVVGNISYLERHEDAWELPEEIFERDITVDFDQNAQADGRFLTTIELTLAESDDAAEASATVKVDSAVPFTQDDISIRLNQVIFAGTVYGPAGLPEPA